MELFREIETSEELVLGHADIFSIKFLPDNIKAHAISDIIESINKFGFVEPILVNSKTNHDLSGNGRLTALRKMFDEKMEIPKGILTKEEKWFVPVVILSVPEENETVLAIKLNRTNEKGGIDAVKAIQVLKKLREDSPQMFLFAGYDEGAMNHIKRLANFRNQLAEVQAETESNKNKASLFDEENESLGETLNQVWQVKQGDCFQIGNHRLICGDSQVIKTWNKLFDKNSARLVFTSPPYDNQREYELGKKKIDWTELMANVSNCADTFTKDPADIIFNLALIYKDGEANFYWNTWLDYCKKSLKSPLYGFYIWDKMTGMSGEYNGRLAPCHEFFFHFSKGRRSANKWIEKNESSLSRGPKKTNFRTKEGKFKQLSSPEKLEQPYKIPDSVIRMQKEVSRGIHTQGHPATFPVGLPEFFINTYTNLGDIVCEPFAGSGTTMVACENLDRRCFAIEISPNYCALILERMKIIKNIVGVKI